MVIRASNPTLNRTAADESFPVSEALRRCRLLIGGCATLLLLGWVAFIPGALPGVIISPTYAPNATPILVSAFLCVLAIVPLVVALFRGSGAERVASALALVFPTLVFLWIIIGGLGR
ncbi:MAG: hypothetical protein AB9869_24525 [Verrucomicrobiia bacterium]